MKFIADISSNHCANLQTAKDLIYSAKESGADYAKFQYWETDKFISKERFENLKIGHQEKWKESVYDTYKKYEIPDNWIPILCDECKKVGIEFLLSCYELSKIDEFDKYVNAWKIGSGDITYYPMLEKISEKKKPIFLGCGASEESEITKAYMILRNQKEFEIIYNKGINKDWANFPFNEVILLKCNTNYSANDEENLKYLNLSLLDHKHGGGSIYYKGISDHTKSDIPIIIAITYGMEYIERHFKLTDNDSPDSSFSLNPEEWKHMIKIARQTKEALSNESKCYIQENERESIIIQRRDNTDWKRPDYGRYKKW